MAKIIMPDPEKVAEVDEDIALPKSRISSEGPANITEGHLSHEVEVARAMAQDDRPANIIEAAAQGAQTGVKLAVAVGAMVLAFVALVALANGLLGWAGGLFGYPDLSFQGILGALFAPVMYLLGIPVGRSAGGRRAVRHQDRAQRIRRLHRPRRARARGAERSQPGDRHLRAMRLRQFSARSPSRWR